MPGRIRRGVRRRRSRLCVGSCVGRGGRNRQQASPRRGSRQHHDDGLPALPPRAGLRPADEPVGHGRRKRPMVHAEPCRHGAPVWRDQGVEEEGRPQGVDMDVSEQVRRADDQGGSLRRPARLGKILRRPQGRHSRRVLRVRMRPLDLQLPQLLRLFARHVGCVH